MAPDAATILADRPRVLQPGLRVLPRGVERFVVAGGGSLTLPVFAGDRLAVVDREGRQPCEIVAMTADGRETPGLIGAADAGPAEGLRTLLGQGGSEAQRLLAALAHRGMPSRFDHAARCFGPDSPAAMASFRNR